MSSADFISLMSFRQGLPVSRTFVIPINVTHRNVRSSKRSARQATFSFIRSGKTAMASGCDFLSTCDRGMAGDVRELSR
jgi:hypothetical protein